MNKSTPVFFKYVDDFPGWAQMPQFIEELIIKYKIKSVLEIGAGANPTLSPEAIKRLEISYTLNDIEKEELDKAHLVYEKNISDLCKANICAHFDRKYDLIFSRMAGEHFDNAENLHNNVNSLLNEKGYAVHCFSTLYAFPFLVNKLIPDWLGNWFLSMFNPREDYYHHNKFKAHYDMSFGPTSKMIKFFSFCGYEIIDYTGYFGHPYYARLPIAHSIEVAKAKWLIKHPISFMTSYASVILQKA
ncbi:MAG: Methyltransferase domain protein [Mucilaginibacter sp.]|nr:Methyltransferase domain protein [Mucilaginibacter sp.]